MTPAVSVAVVSWNTRELLLRCLDSLAADAAAGLAEVIVVDNGSSDGSADAARAHAPWAEVIEPPKNLGFGRAVNLVAGRTDSQWLAIANADVAPQENALEALLAGGVDPAVGAVAPRLVLPDGSTQHSVGPLPTIPLALAFNLGLYRLSPRLADRLCLEGHWNPRRGREVPWAIGAFLLVRRTAFDAVGGFDERQWMYAEDLDLGWRLHSAGWATRYEPEATVLHASGAATTMAFGEDRLVQFMRATYAVLLRRRGLLRTRATASINLLGALGRLAWLTPLALIAPRWRARRRECRRWLGAHREGLRPASTLHADR